MCWGGFNWSQYASCLPSLQPTRLNLCDLGGRGVGALEFLTQCNLFISSGTLKYIFRQINNTLATIHSSEHRLQFFLSLIKRVHITLPLEFILVQVPLIPYDLH